ncbi:MAG: Ni/Fe hydrogenase subunit alpha [bacterium]|nr:Ni/Fe hydrogenase subunit alpha [bacterium]
MPTLNFPLSRIEGHAQAVIEIHGGKVVATRFQAAEFRGFEHFVKGVPAEQMVVIVPRICGVCSTAHHVAAIKALEDAYDVTPPPLSVKIRELLMLGQLIQNQATSLFIFTMPDRLGTDSLFSFMADTMENKELADIAQRALLVRKVGTDLIKLAGGQFIHPVKAVIGGVTSGIGEEEAGKMREQIEGALPIACKLFDYYWEQTLALEHRIGTWGDDEPACYLSAIEETRPRFYGSDLRLIDTNAATQLTFPAREFSSVLTYEDTDYSYAGRTSYKGEVIRANSLARINLLRSLDTPRADEYLSKFRASFGQPAHAILLFDLARGIELIYGLERAMEMLSWPLNKDDTEVGYSHQDGEGFGMVEAPRGPLIHHYLIHEGVIKKAEFIIPTVHNVMAIERALKVAAERYITDEKVDMELERAVGRVVRAFDPCIACATH